MFQFRLLVSFYLMFLIYGSSEYDKFGFEDIWPSLSSMVKSVTWRVSRKQQLKENIMTAYDLLWLKVKWGRNAALF